MNIYGVPGLSMALVKGGRTVWTRAYGFTDVASKREMTEDTCVRVQSISKPITAWGVIRLAGQGLIELDAPNPRRYGAKIEYRVPVAQQDRANAS